MELQDLKKGFQQKEVLFLFSYDCNYSYIEIYKLSCSTSALCSHVPNNLHSAIHFMLPLIPLF